MQHQVQDDAQLPPVHPGDILAEEFLRPIDMSPYALAQRLHVSRPRIKRLVRGENPVTVDTALRLARLFGTTPAFWLNLQTRYDLARGEVATDIEAIEPIGPMRPKPN